MNSDWDYLKTARKGDDSAWYVLIDKHHQRLTKMTFLITGSMEAARDIVQETFFRILQRESKHQDGSFKSYLSTIAYNLALKEKQRLQKHRDMDNLELSDRAPDPLESVLVKERDRVVAQVINSLEEHHRDILVLRFYGDHSYDEIAQITNLSIGTVKSRLFYGVKKCREDLKQRGILE